MHVPNEPSLESRKCQCYCCTYGNLMWCPQRCLLGPCFSSPRLHCRAISNAKVGRMLHGSINYVAPSLSALFSAKVWSAACCLRGSHVTGRQIVRLAAGVAKCGGAWASRHKPLLCGCLAHRTQDSVPRAAPWQAAPPGITPAAESRGARCAHYHSKNTGPHSLNSLGPHQAAGPPQASPGAPLNSRTPLLPAHSHNTTPNTPPQLRGPGTASCGPPAFPGA